MPETFLADIQKLRRVVIPPTVFKTLELSEGQTVRVTIEKLASDGKISTSQSQEEEKKQ
jgi:antitoxin component of MazEF toxin-antitoxin module